MYLVIIGLELAAIMETLSTDIECKFQTFPVVVVAGLEKGIRPADVGGELAQW